MSKALSFSPDIPSFVQENIKKLWGFIQVARLFYLESRHIDAKHEHMEDERAREEFFSQFRRSEGAFRPEVSENPRNLEISPQSKTQEFSKKSSNHNLNISPSNNLSSKVINEKLLCKSMK